MIKQRKASTNGQIKLLSRNSILHHHFCLFFIKILKGTPTGAPESRIVRVVVLTVLILTLQLASGMTDGVVKREATFVKRIQVRDKSSCKTTAYVDVSFVFLDQSAPPVVSPSIIGVLTKNS